MTFIKHFKSTFSEPQKLTVKIALTLLSISSPLLLSNTSWAQTSANTKELSQTQQLESKSKSDVQSNTREIEKIDDALKEYNSQNATLDDKRKAIEVFQNNLKNTDKRVRLAATNALKAIGSSVDYKLDLESVEKLKNRLKTEEDNDVLSNAIAAIQSINATPVISELTEIFKDETKDSQVRSAALRALQTTNTTPEQAKELIPLLLRSLKDQSIDKTDLRIGAAEALAQMHEHLHNQEAINTLKDSLKDPAWRVRRYAADALGNTGFHAKSAVPEIIEAYKKEKNSTMRQRAIIALGNIGKSLKLKEPENSQTSLMVVKLLMNNGIKDENDNVKSFSAKGIRDIAAEFAKTNELKTGELSKAITDLDKAVNYLEDLPQEKINDLDLDTPIQNIESSLGQLRSRQFFKQTLTNPAVWPPIIYLATVFGIFWLRPLWLLKIDKALKSGSKVKLPKIDIEIPLHWLLLTLQYHPRVLDAWVEAHVKSVQEAFEQKDTVSNRNVYIPTPVVKNGKSVAQLTGKDLNSTFKRQRACLLIQGEGGVGKTTLSCQIAKWAMSRDETERLCKHKMLPVLIEEELEIPDEINERGKVRKSPSINALMKAIQGQLQNLTDEMESISEELLERLLRERRILVIVDHLSEMSEETRKAIHPDSPDFYINALVVTSRSEEKLGQVTKTTLKPLLIQGDRLSSFMEAYLIQANKRDLFTDPEFFQACTRLSQMVGGRKVTALLAKLYADQLIAGKIEEIQQVPLLTPGNIPDLMLGYINELNRSVTDNNKLSDRKVQQDAKVIAWECLKQTFRPTTARRDAVLASLEGDDAEIRLQYLEKRLRLIQTIGAAQDKIRFALDPLAEYLAAMQVLKLNQNNQQLWDEFWHQVTIASEDIELIAGFLLALQDCSQANGQEIYVPVAIAEQLSDSSDSTFADKNNNLEQILCPSCGHHNLINNKFCTRCGIESQLAVSGAQRSLN
ncbi:MAG: HEAT repeat domain-containing protein [Rivularia sp. (in: cyanobacteria)]